MANMIKNAYDRLVKIPFGKCAFSKFVGFAAPYSSTISPQVEELKPGYARISMRDKRIHRNHLKSLHAMAMMNLGELATGLAVNYSLPDNARGILKNLSIDFLKKGRGTLTAECHCEVPKTNQKADYAVEAEIRNENKELVAKAKAIWLVGPT
jgi:acyl-coenzyme A thioesterase PaaI-like protein